MSAKKNVTNKKELDEQVQKVTNALRRIDIALDHVRRNSLFSPRGSDGKHEDAAATVIMRDAYYVEIADSIGIIPLSKISAQVQKIVKKREYKGVRVVVESDLKMEMNLNAFDDFLVILVDDMLIATDTSHGFGTMGSNLIHVIVYDPEQALKIIDDSNMWFRHDCHSLNPKGSYCGFPHKRIYQETGKIQACSHCGEQFYFIGVSPKDVFRPTAVL